ncbi:multi drug resistance-associated protein MRP [Halteromyces radiatus]|uniref:multi drug resistance-associated protein MRP n=1 Tax=Halteromyces radiatus TaxID=101107 RepID=UPI00221FFB21|nr:multi drug resistance-associated protein MRP [Halteromyces radiatus]KAI8093508.1 multi drug resistance-associated protein MRP [Halteromyces radiatus]
MEESGQWLFMSSAKDSDTVPWNDNLCPNSEGWGPFSSVRVPDFTPCFEESVVLLVPAAYLILFGMARIWILSKRENLSSDMTRNWLYFAKLITLISLLLTTVASVWITASQTDSWIDNAPLLAKFFNVFVLIFAIGLHHLEYFRNQISSAVLLFYWLFVLIVDGIKLRTLLLLQQQTSDSVQFSLFVISFALSLLMFVLECTVRPKSQYVLLEEDALECPEGTSNIFGRLTFEWMTPLMRLGYEKPLTMDDLWDLQHDDQSAVVGQKFEKYWSMEMKKEHPSLLRALVYSLGGPFFLAALFKALQDVLQFTQPLLLRELMLWVASYASDAPQPAYRGTLIAVGMFITAVCQTMFLHQYFQRCFLTGMRLRAALVTAIYRKTLLLSNASRQQSTVGEIVNHMSVDAQRLMDLCTYLHIVWSGPLQIVIALVLLYGTMGPSIWAGVAVLILTIPLNTYLAKKMRAYQKVQMGNKDARVKLMNEILNGIRVIKLYAWESAFFEKISFIRNDLELAMLKKIGVLSAVQNFTWTSIPFLVSLSSFALFVMTADRPLTSEIAFVAISLFSLLQFPLAVFPNVITSTIEASVSLFRIEGYLSSEELDPNAVTREDYRTQDDWTLDTPLLEINNGTFKWAKEDAQPVLENINIGVKKGDVMAVVGRVGSGKSSLMSAILGDTVKVNGQVIVRGSLAYVPQQPWVMNATVRENITFGHRFDPEFYDRVLEACSLKTDIQILSAGDQTEIGERGINLSGGQKARVSLARAIYARADIYLLDDPLSAVDAHVGRHIFDHVIGPDGILKNKTRLLVTHGISYLPKVDKVVMLRDGQIALNGAYDDLMDQRTELYALMTDFGNQVNNKNHSDDDDDQDTDETLENSGLLDEHATAIGQNEEEASLNKDTELMRRERLNSVSSMMSVQTLRRASVMSLNKKNKKILQQDKERLMTIEEAAKGSVDSNVYKQYAKSCSAIGVAVVLIFQILAQVAQVGSNLWLKEWSNSNQQHQENNRVWMYLGIYALIGWSSTIFSVIQTLTLWVTCAIRSAKVLHSEMLDTVIRSPMSFFDTTPLGRILNRFSKDQHTVDEVLPRAFGAYFRVLFSVVATIGIIAFSTPFFLVLIIPLGFIYLYVQRYYLATSRELKRLDSIGKSPVYSHFQETISGVSTIRAYEQQNRFTYENEVKLDDNQRAYFPSISCNRWLAVRLEFLGSIIIFGAAIFAVIGVLYGSQSYIDPGLVGLSVSYALSVTQALNWVIRAFCEIETNVVSVERIKEYIDLPREKYDSIRGVSPMWPEKGEIEFNGYATRYRAGLDLALKDVSFKIAPKEKIGVCGRTGSGKTSLTLSLFRIIEAAQGNITIDGIDISTLRLFDLRSRLTIIPQDPVLFAGNVRENLDPFGTCEDAEIWQALQHAHLSDHISKMDGKLNATVLEGGENFSVGQRQLICLARALLRRTSILVLDEATAAIDVETDAIIQTTIREQFKNCTIITIAHRINTVIDSDRILVLEKGSILEFDSPQVLLANKESSFYSMSKEAGLVE